MVLEVLSGGITVFTILMGVAVLSYWRKSTIQAIKQRQGLSSEQWLILGVSFGFAGQILDNFYWLLAWTLDFLTPESNLRNWLFDHGTLFNIPFRQLLGSLAAYFHIMAAVHISKREGRIFKNFVILSAILSTAFSLFLIIAYIALNYSVST